MLLRISRVFIFSQWPRGPMPRSWTYPPKQNEPELLLQGLSVLPTVRRAYASLLDLCYKKESTRTAFAVSQHSPNGQEGHCFTPGPIIWLSKPYSQSSTIRRVSYPPGSAPAWQKYSSPSSARVQPTRDYRPTTNFAYSFPSDHPHNDTAASSEQIKIPSAWSNSRPLPKTHLLYLAGYKTHYMVLFQTFPKTTFALLT
ncbi:hypothetical protein JTB14_003306 [Gonioctena quinquepunctata]|nr:hypothetical protein JTB14_003306 [Gonioctena quinquepunctata]